MKEDKPLILTEAEALVMKAFKKLKENAEQHILSGDKNTKSDVHQSIQELQQLANPEVLRQFTLDE